MLNYSDVGPTRISRTIFDEDDLRELADSIQEVGVLQPIVGKRPSEQIEAARKNSVNSRRAQRMRLRPIYVDTHVRQLSSSWVSVVGAPQIAGLEDTGNRQTTG
ncbi:MAG: ParB N-terminal domain-containing protein [Varibaculum sp.]